MWYYTFKMFSHYSTYIFHEFFFSWIQAFVIDCGKIKYTDNDSTENANSVKSQWVNQEIAKQRQNHAGRTQPGICYRLYSSMRQSSFLPDTASLEKMNVEELILRIKLLNRA